jgi:predicted O-methyltransferase YrrM
VEGQLRFLDDELRPFLAEFDPPRASTQQPGRFYLDNGSFESVDAELLYAMVRRYEPRRIIEVGSGFSSLVIGAALAANRAAGSVTAYEIIDPYPASGSADLGGRETLERFATLREETVTEIPLDAFADLGDGDILFVDSTHTVKLGSDVNRMVLDVLPSLAAGVVIHFHDVFLPFEYPREWVTEEGYYWAEQYLLQAFLAFNRSFEVLVAASLLARDHPDRLGDLIPSFAGGAAPGSLWLRRES